MFDPLLLCLEQNCGYGSGAESGSVSISTNFNITFLLKISQYTVQNIENYDPYNNDEKDKTGTAVNRSKKNSDFPTCVKL